jgi:hypothetical protein
VDSAAARANTVVSEGGLRRPRIPAARTGASGQGSFVIRDNAVSFFSDRSRKHRISRSGKEVG